ncbi:DNA-directed RNA polymerase [Cladochytrium replicatum]|nr:DNA-directed RNA polymerase [Cladochytrium replicatum]
MSLVEPNPDATGIPQVSLEEKIEIVQSEFDSDFCTTFVLKEEDHTLGNPLRYILMKNPQVTFCGYSIPHPSEAKIHLRIQTDGTITAYQALHKGLDDLMELCNYVVHTFKESIKSGVADGTCVVEDGADLSEL